MSYPINYPTPQNADVQIFSRGNSTSDWVKPQGCSFVHFFLIGAGGDGASGTSSVGGGGGASGALANFLCPAFLIPDVLRVFVGKGGVGNTTANRTRVEYQQKAGTAYEILLAASGANASGSSGGANPSAMGANYFTAMGFFAGNSGQTGANAGASITQTNFISAGAGGGATLGSNGGSVTPLYGYPVISGGNGSATPTDGKDGISIFSNFLFACGGAGGGASQNLPTATGADGGDGGFGSGGGGGGIGSSAGSSSGGKGGDGLVVIVSW